MNLYRLQVYVWSRDYLVVKRAEEKAAKIKIAIPPAGDFFFFLAPKFSVSVSIRPCDYDI